MADLEKTRLRIEEALSAHLELLSGGASGAATYRVHGLSEPCVLKVVAAESPAYLRARGRREVRFYRELAAHVPLQTPHVLGGLVEASGACALLLAAYAPIEPASELKGADFAEIAEQLAGFHAVYWDRTAPFDAPPWTEKPKTVDLTHDAQHASRTWQVLARQPQFQELLTDATLRDLEAALAEVQKTPEYGPETPMTLCHGDLHLGNLLRGEDGGLVWADWQEVRVGYGPSDLSFLFQRAEAEGAVVPHEGVIAAYCNALEVAGVEGVSEDAVTASMNESERRTRLLYWPDYLGGATPETMSHHLMRIFSR